jgi:hypothetical protein
MAICVSITPQVILDLLDTGNFPPRPDLLHSQSNVCLDRACKTCCLMSVDARPSTTRFVDDFKAQSLFWSIAQERMGNELAIMVGAC